MQQIPVSLLTLLAGVFAMAASFWVGQNSHIFLPVQASEQAPLVDGLFNLMFVIGTALFILVEGTILLFFIVFRKRAGDETDGIHLEGNFPLEILWTAIPAILVIWLGAYSVDIYEKMGGFSPSGSMVVAHDHSKGHSHKGSAIAAPVDAEGEMIARSPDAPEPVYGIGRNGENLAKLPEVTVNVLGLQYAWIFTYADTGIVSGELHVPVGKRILLNLAAQDVIHSFWIPQFRLKQDAIPGQKTDLQFVATRTGTFPVVCTELCGAYHGSMRTQIIVHTPEEYEQWVSQNQIAQAEGIAPSVIATNPSTISDRQFLEPYAQEMGIEPHLLHQLRSGV